MTTTQNAERNTTLYENGTEADLGEATPEQIAASDESATSGFDGVITVGADGAVLAACPVDDHTADGNGWVNYRHAFVRAPGLR